MKEKSIELLNAAVADELNAVHQYMYFHFHCDDQGYDLLANLFKRTAIECSQNADSVSKTLFESLVEDEERHLDQYDNEMENLKKFGNDYLALQSIERSRNAGSSAEE